MEYWKSITGYEGFYESSNFGRIKALERPVRHPKGGLQILKERVLKQGIRKGYCFVVLSKNNMQKSFSVHRLVASTFLKNPENKRTVNHKDGDKINNKLENLEWATYSENEQHSIRTGLNDKRKRVKQFSKNKILIKIWDSVRDAERQLKIKSSGVICKCCKKMKGYKTAGGFFWEYCLKD